MGQQPNNELAISDLPRPVAHPAPARSWAPGRPGEIDGPGIHWGGGFGTTGPDTGYALKLVGRRHLELAEGESHHGAETAVTLLAGARASFFGRAPVLADIDAAAAILGYTTEGVPAERVAQLSAERPHRVANLAHDPARARALVGAVPVEALTAPLADIRRRLEAGEHLVTW